MTTETVQPLLQLIRRRVEDQLLVQMPDQELLRRFNDHQDETAFCAILRRHGPMVLDVCRGVLGNEDDVEDAFQATFLVLVHKVGSVRKAASLGSWLYGVAYRTALKARAQSATRRKHEGRTPVCHTRQPDDLTWRELQQVLHEELARLPERYRAPLVSCYLQGKTQDEAALSLGVSEATLKKHAERGRALLQARLARRGFGPTALVAFFVWPAATPSACLPPVLVSSAVQAARLLMSGKTATALLMLPRATTLADGLVRPMFFTKMKLATTVLLLAGLLGIAMSASVPAGRTRASEPGGRICLVEDPKADGPATENRKPATDRAGDPLPQDALLRLGTLRQRRLYDDIFGRNQLLPDGKTVVTSSENAVRWVDNATGRLKESWPLPKGQHVLGFSHDGQLALLGDDGSLHLWDLVARKELRALEGKGEPGRAGAIFSPDGSVVAAHSDDTIRRQGLVRVWDIVTGRKLWQESMVTGFWDNGLTLVGFPPDCRTLVLLDNSSNRVSLRDRDTGQELHSFATLPRNDSRACGLSPDGQALFMGTAGTAVHAWDLATGKELPLLDGHRGQANQFALSRDSKTVLTGGSDPFVLVWDWPAGKLRGRIELGAGKGLSHLAVSADGKKAEIICGGDRAVRLFDLESSKELPPPCEGHLGPVLGVALTPDGQVISAGGDNTVRVWDLRTGQPLHEHRTEHATGASRLTVSADGRLVATSDYNSTAVALHDRDTGRLVRTIDPGGQFVWGIAFAPEGRLLALSGNADPRGAPGPPQPPLPFLSLWNADSGRQLSHQEGDAFHLVGPVFSPDGKFLAGYHPGRRQVRLLEVPTGRERAAFPLKNVHGVAFSPDGRTLACGDTNGITLWEVATRKERARLEAPPRLHSLTLQFSPDGRWLAWGGGAAGDEGAEAVHLWDVRRGEKVRPLEGHRSPVAGLAFAPDGGTLASCSWDTTVLIWDIASVERRQAGSAARADAAALAAAWDELASANARTAYHAVRLLAATLAQSVPLLRERLRAIPPADRKQVERWLAGLDSDSFAEREEATRGLERQGELVEGALRQLLAGNPSAEARRRAEILLAAVEGPVTDAERLRQVRGVEVLEWIGKGEARNVLEALAKGDTGSSLARDAATALRRLGRRP
jgi:RNA polymerase sigma factor (sigma-70 family)